MRFLLWSLARLQGTQQQSKIRLDLQFTQQSQQSLFGSTNGHERVVPFFRLCNAEVVNISICNAGNNDMRLPWYDNPTAWVGWCRAVTPWQPQD